MLSIHALAHVHNRLKNGVASLAYVGEPVSTPYQVPGRLSPCASSRRVERIAGIAPSIGGRIAARHAAMSRRTSRSDFREATQELESPPADVAFTPSLAAAAGGSRDVARHRRHVRSLSEFFELESPPAAVRLPSPDETAAGGSRDECPDSEVRSICRDS